ncbi:MAG: hypothetical protein HC789_22575 [Microcoleus sp. CSU_2_2]|nr:hypothetical protein [Microcoleus sp. SU_5_3]NJS12950.1 hypothetical protein [Microcoleus sp. CSU_2_2]
MLRPYKHICKTQMHPATDTIGNDARVCSYMTSTMLSSTVKKLIKDPGILAIAAKFLGGEPIHMGSRYYQR